MSQDPAAFCPYVGIRPHLQNEEAYFFGRDRDKRIICSNLAVAPLTILYAASGVGKSSLLQAGIVPFLQRRQRTAVIYFREWQDPDYLARLRSGFLEEVSRAFGQAKVRTSGSAIVNPADYPLNVNLPLDVLCANASKLYGGSVLVIFDQFHDYLLGNPASTEETSFDAEFARAVNREDAPVNFLVALREDFLSKMDRFRSRIPNLMANTLRLDSLDVKTAAESLRKPTEAYNTSFGEPYIVRIPEEGSAEDPVPDIVQSATAEDGRIESASLQLVMKQLWESETESWNASGRKVHRELRRSTLRDRLGGASHIINTFIARSVASLTESEKNVAFGLFRALVGGAANRITRDLQDLTEYAVREEPSATAVDVERVLGVLDAAGIVRKIPKNRYEIGHDVLARAVLAWRRERSQQREMDQDRLHTIKRQQEIARKSANTRLKWWSVAMTTACVLLAVAVFTSRRNLAIAQSNALAVKANIVVERDPELALLLARYAIQYRETPSALDALYHAVEDSRARLTLPVPGKTVTAAAYSRDGRWIATGGTDVSPRIWNAFTGELLATLPAHGAGVNSAAFADRRSSDDRVLVTGSDDKAAKIWTFPGGDPARATVAFVLSGHTDEVWGVAFSRDGLRVATSSADGTAKLWDALTGKELRTLKGHTKGVVEVAFSPDGKLLATTSLDRTAMIWDLAGTREPMVLRGHKDYVYGLAFNPSGNLLATASWDGTAIVWDVATGAPGKPIQPSGERLWGVAFSPDGSRLALTSRNGTAAIVDAVTGETLISFTGKASALADVAFDPTGKQLITGSMDEFAKIWDASLTLLGNKSTDIRRTVFTGDGATFASAGIDRVARLWSATGGETRETVTHPNEIRGLSFSSDGKRLVTACEDGLARIWNMRGEFLDAVTTGTDPVYAAILDSRGARLATASWDKTVKIWDLASKTSTTVLTVEKRLYSAAWSADDRYLAAGGEDDNIMLVDLTSDSKVTKLLPPHPSSRVYSLAFSADGHHLAAGWADGTAMIWDVNRPDQPGMSLTGHATSVRGLQFSHDGSMVATASDDGTAKVWDAVDGENIHTTYGHTAPITGLTFAPGDRELITVGEDRLVRTHPLGAKSVEDLARSRTTRQLTPEECQSYLQLKSCPALK